MIVFLTVYSTSVKANITNITTLIALQKAAISNDSNDFQISLNNMILMDKSELNQLINKVNNKKKEIKEPNGGVYI